MEEGDALIDLLGTTLIIPLTMLTTGANDVVALQFQHDELLCLVIDMQVVAHHDALLLPQAPHESDCGSLHLITRCVHC